MLQPWWYNRELKERHFLATHVNSKYGLLSFYTLWCYQISIAKFLFSYSVYRRFTREFEPNQCSVIQKVYFWLKSVAQKCLQCLSSLICAWNRTLACIFWCHCRPLHCYYCPAVVIQYKYHFMRTRFLSIFLGCGFFITTIDLLCWYNTFTWTGFRWIKWTIAFHHPDKMHLG